MLFDYFLFEHSPLHTWYLISSFWHNFKFLVINVYRSITMRSGVNFINVKRTNFSYKRCFSSFYYVHVTRKKTAKMTFVRKIRAFNIDEIDYR